MRIKKMLKTLAGTINVFASVVALMALASGNAALAGNKVRQSWTTVSGDSTPSSCAGDGVIALELTGDLDGCWAAFPENFSCDELGEFAWYRETGREEFVGTIFGELGEFTTTYTIEAVFAPGFCSSFDVTTELAGGCVHYVKGLSGSFRGVVGKITFFDIIPDIDINGGIIPGSGGATNFLYVGQLNRGGD